MLGNIIATDLKPDNLIVFTQFEILSKMKVMTVQKKNKLETFENFRRISMMTSTVAERDILSVCAPTALYNIIYLIRVPKVQ